MSRLQALLDIAGKHGVSIEDADRLIKAHDAVERLMKAAADLEAACAIAAQAFQRLAAAVADIQSEERQP